VTTAASAPHATGEPEPDEPTVDDGQGLAAAPQDFESIYVQHFDFACRSLRLLGVPPDALEDAAQDVFGIVHRRLHEFAGRSSLKTWIFSVVQRVAANQRRTRRRKQTPLQPLSEGFTAKDPSPEACAQAAQSAALIQAFCDTLDDGRRAVLVLGLLEGVPVRELALTLDIPLHTVYSRIRALREALKVFLERHEVERD
jgi:RNA polymerase sigma-70 factor (ECF subfamily)